MMHALTSMLAAAYTLSGGVAPTMAPARSPTAVVMAASLEQKFIYDQTGAHAKPKGYG